MNENGDEPGERAVVVGHDGLASDLSIGTETRTGRVSWPLRLLLYMLGGIRKGTLEVELPDGSTRRFEGAEPGPHGVWRIVDGDRLVRHLLAGGEVGIGDAFLDDCWDTPDLTRLLMTLYVNEPHYRGPFEKNWIGRLHGWWQHRRNGNTRRTARRNIEHHYDLGNDFYALWLDETMVYSSAVFAHPTQSLRDAQLEKFRLIHERLDLDARHTLLEIGSGWGGFAIYAAQRSGCRVHSITLSREQLNEARRRAELAGVSDRLSFELCDYRDVRGQYDRVVSIEMYEAVGEEWWPAYFDAIHRALAPGGRAVIQGITIDDALFAHYRRKRDFIQKYIFPGGMLCPAPRFQALAEQAGLRPRDARFFALDYAETLAHWQRNVRAARDPIVARFGERFLRMWRYYLSYCECGFRTGSIDLMQVTLDKP